MKCPTMPAPGVRYVARGDFADYGGWCVVNTQGPDGWKTMARDLTKQEACRRVSDLNLTCTTTHATGA